PFQPDLDLVNAIREANAGPETPEKPVPEPVAQPQAESIKLYHASPNQFGQFDLSKATPADFHGGKSVYFSAEPQTGAYGENVKSIEVPTDKLYNVQEDPLQIQGDQPFLKTITDHGYEGWFDLKTGEYGITNPNKFLPKPTV